MKRSPGSILARVHDPRPGLRRSLLRSRYLAFRARFAPLIVSALRALETTPFLPTSPASTPDRSLRHQQKAYSIPSSILSLSSMNSIGSAHAHRFDAPARLPREHHR